MRQLLDSGVHFGHQTRDELVKLATDLVYVVVQVCKRCCVF
jgi:ribosomal protein S2